MSCSRSAIVGALLASLVPTGASSGAQPGAAITPRAKVTHLPGPIYRVGRHLDGSAVCCAERGVFLSTGDPHRWSAVRNLPQRIHSAVFWPIGGDRTRFFATGNMYAFDSRLPENAYASARLYALAAVNTDGEFRIVWDKTPGGDYGDANKAAAFASKDVGALAWNEYVHGAPVRVDAAGKMLPVPIKSTLLLTTDGGSTWKPVAAPVSESQAISRLLWVSQSRLLIACSDGSVQLVEHKSDDTLVRVWSATAGGIDAELMLDGQYVWAGREPWKRLKLADGQLDATVSVPALPWGKCKRVSCCYGRLVAEGWDKRVDPPQYYTNRNYRSFEDADAALKRNAALLAEGRRLDIWTRDLKAGYVRRFRIPAPEIVAVLPLKEPLCLAITRGGQGMRLDVEKGELSPVELQVTPLPPPLPHPSIASPEEINVLKELFKQMPPDDRDEIFARVMKTRDRSPEQRVELLIKEYQQYLQEHKPSPEAEKRPGGDRGSTTLPPQSNRR